MSSSVAFAIRKGSVKRDAGEGPDAEVVKKVQYNWSIGYSVIFSIVYIGAAANFLVNILSIWDECNMQFTKTSEPGLGNYCSNRGKWKICAILILVFPGALQLLFGLITLPLVARDPQGKKKVVSNAGCFKLWNIQDSIAKLVNVAVLVTLFSSGAHSTVVGGNSGLRTAAIIYLCVVGIEVGTILLLACLGIALALCACTAVLCATCFSCCCPKVSAPQGRNKNDPEESVPMN